MKCSFDLYRINVSTSSDLVNFVCALTQLKSNQFTCTRPNAEVCHPERNPFTTISLVQDRRLPYGSFNPGRVSPK